MTKCMFAAVPVTIIAICAAVAAVAGDTPSRRDVAAAFNLRAGVHRPVIVAGTNFEAQYVRIEQRRDGDYALIFRLTK